MKSRLSGRRGAAVAAGNAKSCWKIRSYSCDRELRHDAEEACPVRRLVTDFERLAAISRRARKRVGELRGVLETDERQAIELSFEQAQVEFQGLQMTMAGLFEPAPGGTRHAET